jgi:hypothetical protein
MWVSEWRENRTVVNTQLTRVAFVNNEFWVAVFGSRASVAGFQSGGEKCRYLERAVLPRAFFFFQKFPVFITFREIPMSVWRPIQLVVRELADQ